MLIKNDNRKNEPNSLVEHSKYRISYKMHRMELNCKYMS